MDLILSLCIPILLIGCIVVGDLIQMCLTMRVGDYRLVIWGTTLRALRSPALN